MVALACLVIKYKCAGNQSSSIANIGRRMSEKRKQLEIKVAEI